MVHGTVRSLFQLLGAIGMTILVFVAWFGFRLSEGPLNLSFLTPYIEDALSSPDGHFVVKLDQTLLMWSDEAHTLEVRAEGVKALAGGDTVIAAVPEMSVSLSAPAILRGVVAPKSLRLLHPIIRLRRDRDGHMEYGLGDPGETNGNAAQALDEAFQALLTAPGGDTAASQLKRIEVVAGDLVIEDQVLGMSWHAPRADLRFLRDHRGIAGHARIDLDLAGEPGRLEVDGLYRISDRAVEATLGYGGIRPSLFAALTPQLQPLAAIRLPMGGAARIRYSLDKGLTDLYFDLAGGAGALDASEWLGVSWPVQSVALRGALTNDLSRLALDEFRVDLGGPVVTLSAHADGIGAAMTVDGTARVEDLPVNDLKSLWPPGLAPNPRNWILANLSQGRVRSAFAKVKAHLPAGQPLASLVIDDIGGEVHPEGVTVQYLNPMPPVRNVSAAASFDANTFAIDIKSGEVMGLKVTEGKVTLGGLSAVDQTADINLKIAGPVDDALRLIDSKPLGWAKALGIQPAKVKGDAATHLHLAFPLLQTLTFDQVGVHASAHTRDLAIPGVAMGLDLRQGSLALDVDAKGMDVEGKALLGGMPADITWRENFSKAVALRSRYHVTAVMDDDMRKTVGLDVAPFQAPFMAGPIPVDMTASLYDGGRGNIDVRANLTPAAMQLPGLNWDKPAGVTASAQASLRLAGGRLDDIPRFSVVAANGLDVQGVVDFDKGLPRRVTFQRARWGRTDVKGTLRISPAGAGLAVDVSGTSFDARELVSGRASDHRTDQAAPKPEQAPRPETPASREHVTPLTVQARVGQVWVTDTGLAKNVTAFLSRDDRDWQRARIDAIIGGDQPLTAEMVPTPGRRRTVKVSSTDAGAVLRLFSIYDNVAGGTLTVDGVYDDNDPRQPLTGVVKISNYQLVGAPALARMLTMAALTGIVELLSGDGIHFSTLEAPFTLTDGVLELHDARAYGAALGLTAKGQVDLENNELALEGTVVPIYAVNSILGKIPLVGSVFSAEKGGGIVAMNYSMKGPAENPNVTINPLSALTPGFLRKLFNIFEDGSDTEVRPKGASRPKDEMTPPQPPAAPGSSGN